MELKDTITMMTSADYKERFKAEYYQAKIRAEKLDAMLRKYKLGYLDFTPTCPIEVLEKQYHLMIEYLMILTKRAAIEGIILEDSVDEN